MFEKFFREFYEELISIPSEAVFLFLVGKSMGKKYALSCDTSISPKTITNIIGERKLGIITLEKSDLKKKEFVFKLEDSAFKTNLGKNSCHVVSGALAGFIEHYHGKYTGACETKCVSRGDPYCQFHVKVVGKEC